MKTESWILGLFALVMIGVFFWLAYETGFMNGRFYGRWAADCVHKDGKVLGDACYSKDVLISTHD